MLPLTSTLTLLNLSLTSALSIPQALNPQYIFSNPPPTHQDESQTHQQHIPTLHESTIMARRILHLSTIGNLVTSFPLHNNNDDPSTLVENRPTGVQGNPIGLMEYYADCEPDTGNPTLLAIDIATPYKNFEAGSNISLGVRWWPKASNSYFYNTEDSEEIPTPRTPAALPRFSLHGHLEPIPAPSLASAQIPACFLKAHPDSVLWQPGNDISHESEYVRLVVEYVYWFGGFGDRARIGWVPVEEWRGVTVEEIRACRLPGEEEGEGKGWWRDWF